MSQFVLRVEAVSSAIRELLLRTVHPTFAGYLCLKRESRRVGRASKLEPDFIEFHRTFLEMPGGPANKPYYRPFWNETESEQKAWYQRNVAGTYSPRSARRIEAFSSVVNIQNQQYSLPRDHDELALQYLLYNQPLPIQPLVIFLYRDFGLDLPAPPKLTDLIHIFQDEFGYNGDAEMVEYRRLFDDTSIAASFTDVFETPQSMDDIG